MFIIIISFPIPPNNYSIDRLDIFHANDRIVLLHSYTRVWLVRTPLYLLWTCRLLVVSGGFL